MYNYEFTLAAKGILVPQDHGYMLHSALSKQFPFLHGRHGLQIAPLRGTRTQEEHPQLILDSDTILHVRGISNEEADQMLDHGYFFLGSRQVWVKSYRKTPLRPSDRLVSRLVLFRDAVDGMAFIETLKSKVPEGVSIEVGRSRAALVKKTPDRLRVWKGYRVTLTNLTPEQSLSIQQTGIGHCRALGCGVFYRGTL